jgi:hypothetical protein
MKTRITEQGLVISKQMLGDVDEVEIRRESDSIVILLTPSPDPILEFGKQPIQVDATDASAQHDRYLYGAGG